MPILEVLEFELWDDAASVVPIDLFADAPRLQTFSAGRNVSKTTLTLPWNQLRDIRDKKRAFNMLSSLIEWVASAPDIESYRLQVNGYGQALTLTHAIVQLPKLQSLSVMFCGLDSTPYALLAALHMPNICELSLITNISWDLLMPPLVPLCYQISLHKLALRTDYNFKTKKSQNLTSKDMVQILKAAQQLRVLEIMDIQPAFLTKSFMETFALLSPSGTPILCPKLQTIVFRQSRHTDLASFAHALQMRTSSGTQTILKTIIIVCKASIRASFLENLRTFAWWDQLRDVGIDVQVGDWASYSTRS